ncbi:MULTISPECIES: glutamyl-tRNA reductase [unclassified Cryobacterium]|uniref:glutamyl-tRNA reductase n=1 Tax=unclassified Cryobacterium TaxID=2649013 RepID=UPI001444C676
MIHCVSVSHRTSDFDFLESLTTKADSALGTLGGLAEIDGAVVLSTCNRFEVYVDSEHPDAIAAVADATGVDADELAKHATTAAGEGAARHLFSVAAGLESVVVGEDEISGQVSRALTAAREAGTTSSRLEKLFQAAAKTSRGVKTRTALGSSGRSLVRLALELASSRFADWRSLRILIVGTGRYAATTVAALRERGASDLSVFSPSGRAATFASKYSLDPVTDLEAAIADAQLVITCTSYEHPVITEQHVSEGNRRLFVDLGMPRNISSGITAVPHVELLDLETISLHAPLEALTATADARELVTTAAAQFTADSTVAPAVVAMREHVLDLLSTELEQHSANPEIERALRHFAGVLLHGPSVRARELAEDGRGHEFVAGIEAVFGARAGHERPAAESA